MLHCLSWCLATFELWCVKHELVMFVILNRYYCVAMCLSDKYSALGFVMQPFLFSITLILI